MDVQLVALAVAHTARASCCLTLKFVLVQAEHTASFYGQIGNAVCPPVIEAVAGRLVAAMLGGHAPVAVGSS